METKPITTQKGVYFTFDALFALMLLLIAFVTIFNIDVGRTQAQLETETQLYQQLSSVAEDSLQVASYASLSQSLSAEERLYYHNTTILSNADMNNSVIENIAILWASDDRDAARNLTHTYFDKLIGDQYNYSVTIVNGNRSVLYNTSNRQAGRLSSATRIISGIQKNKPQSGHIAKATLSEATSQKTDKTYFGGYVGDGNITVQPDIGTAANVTSVIFEADIGGPFDMYINNNFTGHYTPNNTATNLSASRFVVCNATHNPSYCGAVTNGTNTIRFNFTNTSSSLGGGFLSIEYISDAVAFSSDSQYREQNSSMPGIDGVINLFSSFAVPGQLHDIAGRLHYTVENRTIFLKIADTIVYQNTADGEVTHSLNSTHVRQQLLQPSGEVNISPATDGSTWTSINFTNTYNTPLVFATSQTENDGQSPKTVQIRNVTKKSFEARFCEHENGDGNCDAHGAEQFGYMVVDRDEIDALEGAESGTVSISGDGVADSTNIQFDKQFSSKPVIVAEQQTYDQDGESIVQVTDVTANGFNLYLCDHSESNTDSCESHTTEEVAWIAIHPKNNPFSVAISNTTPNIGDSSWTSQQFPEKFNTTPAIMASIQTNNGGQQAKPVMARQVNATHMDIRYCEHDGGDTCDGHNQETVGWLAAAPGTLNIGITNVSDLSETTVPYRVALQGLDQTQGRAIADSVSVIDVSGSMDGSPLDEAKNASHSFVEILLNETGNRVGMVAYNSDIDTTHELTTDNTTIHNTIDGLTAGGNTCIGCGILKATDIVLEPKYETIVSKQSKWRWNASYPNTAPPYINGSAWTEPSYNDSGWQYNTTILGRGPNANTGLPDNDGDYYVRKQFTYDREKYKDFTLYLRSDDKATVYLNDHLIVNETQPHTGTYWNTIINGQDPFFIDSYERDNLDNNWTITSGTEGDEVTIDSTCGATDGTQAMILRWGGATVETKTFNLSQKDNATLSYRVKQGGDSGGCEQPESGEDITIEYLANDGSWNTVKTHAGAGTDPSRGKWGDYSVTVPQDADQNTFKARITYSSASGSDYDYWAIDKFTLAENTSVNNSLMRDGTNTLAARLQRNESGELQQWITDTEGEWEQGNFTNTTVTAGNLTLAGFDETFFADFESGVLSSNWSCGGSCGVSSACATHGSYAAYHKADAGSVTSTSLNLSTMSAANISYWAKKGTDSCSEPPENGEDFYVEYYASDGSWKTLEELKANKMDDGEEVESTMTLPGDALHSNFQVRFRQTDGSGNDYDYWHFDNVKIQSTAATVTKGNYTSTLFDAGSTVNWTDASITTNNKSQVSVDYYNGSHWFDTISQVPDSQQLRFNLSLHTNDKQQPPQVDSITIDMRTEVAEFDMAINASEERKDSMIVMSDGEANIETAMNNVPDHDNDSDVDAKDHTIEAGCRAYEGHNITVYAVGFGSGADNQTLNLTAQCGNGQYYFSSTGELEAIFANISNTILNASFTGQTIETDEEAAFGQLHPDSHLQFNYTPTHERDFGTFALQQKSDRFGGNVTSPKNGTFTVPSQTQVLQARTTSYSANYWTDRLSIKNDSGQFSPVYQLWEYGDQYRTLGDPYTVFIPPDTVRNGTNTVQLDTGFSKNDTYGGSPDNRVFYTLQVDGSVGYGNVFERFEGGNTTVASEFGSFTLSVGNTTDAWNTSNDALDNAVQRLLDQLDVDGNGKIDVQLEADNLNVASVESGNIPWLFGPIKLKVEVWE